MTLLLLFSILSTIQASVAQKPTPIFFSMKRSQQVMSLKIIKKIVDFRKFYYPTFLVNLHHSSHFDPTKKSAKLFFMISAAFLVDRAPLKKNLVLVF